jgi:carboxylesterase type B
MIFSDCPQVFRTLSKAWKQNPVVAMALPDELRTIGEAMGAGPNQEYNEDCLTLNVWTKPQEGEKKKAVLVWIYGGGIFTPNYSENIRPLSNV